MSGGSIPYHLRPHKAVDRRVFVDLLTRFERWQPLQDYVYISMGAYPLEDHKLIHRVLGITHLIAFDLDPEIVNRQQFNRPVETCYCIHARSDELITNLDAVLKRCNVSREAGLIFWLDYTDPGQLGEQIREFEALLPSLRAGDVVRVTVNAHPRELFLTMRPSSGTPPRSDRARENQFNRIKSLIAEFLPSTATSDDMTEDKLPLVLSSSFRAAANKALPSTGDVGFLPLSVVRYADGQQMLSMTGTVIRKSDANDMLKRLDMTNWSFWSRDWTDIHHLIVPALTVRERLFLERSIATKTKTDLIAELGFSEASDISVDAFLDSYRSYYRFYPTLLAADP